MINVTKTFLPPIEEYNSYLKDVWESGWITNRGTLVKQLETEICSKLGLEHLLFVSNGTIAIQIAIKALEITGEIITTPFSYVATTTSILWENCTPVFCDINPTDLCINADNIENLITAKTKAILATHVYGIPCDVEKIELIAKKHNLKVIYDAAHAFGVKYKNKNIFTYGDISTCSFHATKVFHTVEGGSITCNIPKLREAIFLQHSFGHLGDDYYSVGINAKNSEFHAAMGLCNIKLIDKLINSRKNVSEYYDSKLNLGKIYKPKIKADTEYNFSYYPIIFESENVLLKVKDSLHQNEINTRRYFYPSLNNLPYITNTSNCEVSDDISKRVLCLPMYSDLDFKDIDRISKLINQLI